MHQIAMLIAQDLDFHMPRRGQPTLQKQRIVAKGRTGLAPRTINGVGQTKLDRYGR